MTSNVVCRKELSGVCYNTLGVALSILAISYCFLVKHSKDIAYDNTDIMMQ